MKAYIVEDHESMRIILKHMVKKNFPLFVAIGESETAERALEEIPSFRPDLVLVDISLPGMDGIELIRRLKSKVEGLFILVVTGHEVDVYRQAALQAGADDIVSKNDGELLLSAIRKLLQAPLPTV